MYGYTLDRTYGKVSPRKKCNITAIDVGAGNVGVPRGCLLYQPYPKSNSIRCILPRYLLSPFEWEDLSSRWLPNEMQTQDSLSQSFISLFNTIRRLHRSGVEREGERERTYKIFRGDNKNISTSPIQWVKIPTPTLERGISRFNVKV